MCVCEIRPRRNRGPRPELQRVTASLALHDPQGLLHMLCRPLVSCESADELLVGISQHVVLEDGCAPVASLFLLYYWGSLDCGIFGIFVRWGLRCCIVRAVLVAMMDNLSWHCI